MPVSDLGKVGVDVGTGRAPCGRHFLDQDRGSPLDVDGLRFIERVDPQGSRVWCTSQEDEEQQESSQKLASVPCAHAGSKVAVVKKPR